MALIEAPNTPLPWMVKADLNDWFEFCVDHTTVKKGTNGKGWNCYFADLYDIEGIEDKNLDEEEIPFWAMEAFYDELIEVIGADNKGEPVHDILQFKFKRTRSGTKNTAQFRFIGVGRTA